MKLLLFLLICLATNGALFGQNKVLRWQRGADFADTFTHNGFEYKTVNFPNFFVAVSPGANLRAPSRALISVTSDYFMANVVLRNLTEERLELRTAGITCECTDRGKLKVLVYEIPAGVGPELTRGMIRDTRYFGTANLRGSCHSGEGVMVRT